MEDFQRLAAFTAFATVGTITAAQELAGRILEGVEQADPELVAEESLCLACTVAARAAAFGFRGNDHLARTASGVLLDLPFTWRDYHVAGVMLAEGQTAPPDAAETLYARLGRKMEFYGVHLADGVMPGERLLSDKMALWMGRVSPPGLPEMPEKRLARLDLVAAMVRHARLIREHAVQSTGDGSEGL